MLTSIFLLFFTVLPMLVAQTMSHVSSGPHIADINILLPPKMTHPVEYRLQGSDGCFKWSWDHHDILSVVPEYNSSSHCSTSAQLKSIAPYSGRKETAVYATDVNTGMVIRCKVYIDIMLRIQIFHNSVKLDLDGLATLRVRAFDSEDNVFSSLVGLQFTWQLMPETDGLPHHLVHVPLKDSPLSDCGGLCGDLDIQVKLEDSGVFSDLYVVKGTEIGHEIVSVHLMEPSFEHMADKIVLTVAEAMSLNPPSPVFVLIGAVVRYTLKVIRSNIPHVVSLPSPFHRWYVLNSSVAQVEREMGETRALNIGVTTVTVEDTRVVGHIQMSSLHVVIPDTLLLFILPLSLSGATVEGIKPIPSASRWYVVSGRQYLIHVKVFTPGPGAKEIYITERDDIKLHDDQYEFWDILPVSEGMNADRNYRILRANSYGLGRLTATLTYSSGQDTRKEVLKLVQEVMVCELVKFSMEERGGPSDEILLPWVHGVYQELELKATGGCAMSSSDYKWFSSDMAVVSVSASGIVEAKKPGKATIKVVSIFDSLNYDEMIIEVSIPTSMVMLPYFPVETLVGSYLQASVTLQASGGSYFYTCDAFRSSIRWKTESEYFTIVNATVEPFVYNKQDALSSSYGPPCARTLIYASNSGRTLLHATLTQEYQQFDHASSGSIVLKASSRIAAYLPLIVHQANDGNQFGGYSYDLSQAEAQNQLENLDYLYLTPGTHLDVMLQGGPERWHQGVEFIEVMEALDEHNSYVTDRVLMHLLLTSNSSAYRIQCQSLGSFKLIFRRGNMIGDGHQLPAVVEVQLLLMCSFPSSIVLIADEAVNSPQVIQSAVQAERNPEGVRASPITVANGRRIRISAVGISNSGKAFANSSSLSLRWELPECEGLVFMDDVYSSSVTKSSWERFFILQNTSGLCDIRSTVIGFIDSLSHLDFTKMFEGSSTALTDAIQLQLVSSLRVNPEHSLLFFSPDARLNLSITGGSGFLDTRVNDTQIVEVIQPPPGFQGSQLTLAPKSLGPVLVTVHDIGVAPPLAASSVVQVADVDWIKITMASEISLIEGSLQSISFSAGISDGRTFDSSQYIYMKIRVHIEDHIVDLVDSNGFSTIDGYVNGQNFTIQATHLGVTTIYLSTVQQSGHEILSQPVKVEVYAPPRIHPGNIFLVPGASYVLAVKGGPKIGSYVEYASMNDETAKIHESSGLLSAISLGNTTLVATIFGNGDIMLCQAYGKVKVGIPSSALLNVQSKQVAVGRQMPIYPSLSEGSLFSFYELCKDFKWRVEDEEVLNFQVETSMHVEEHKQIRSTASAYVDEKDRNFIQMLYGRSAGKTNVTVTFSCNFISFNSVLKSRFYSASTSLRVVPDLPLALGSSITWILPSYYTSSDLLPSSSHTYDKGDSMVRKGTITYSLLGQYSSQKIGEVQDEAIFIDGAKIRTKESDNLACIQAKDGLTARTEIASCVRVDEIAQVRILTEEFPVHTLALGAELYLPIKYHDVLGNPFHEAYNITLFEAETNYPDVVSIDTHNSNGYIHIKARNHGIALVQIAFIINSQKADYVMIFVGPRLYPQNPVLHQGTRLNFRIEGLSDLLLGHWSSANQSVVSIDKQSGQAEAIEEGTTRVRFHSSSFKLQTSVTVLKGNILSVDAPKETLTNVPFPTNGYGFSVKFVEAHNKHHESSGDSLEFLFDCTVDPPYVGYAQPWRDLDTDNLYCLFFPYPPERLAHSAPSSRDSSWGISVTINASLRGDSRVSGSASTLFIGGFTVLEMEKNSMHLNLTEGSNKGVITIIGNTDVEIHWHNKDRLSIQPVHGENRGVRQRVPYEVKVHGAERFKDQLVITLLATGQRVEVDVSYEPEERTESATSANNVMLWASLAGSFFLLILTVTAVICYLDRPERSRQNVVSGTPSVAAPITPERSTPSVVNEQSPRTPQPFLDYVRRTIDETPYYRQDVKRRINPQNTF
ncbi:Nuclear pore complex protein [Forsythia ovata]|uniref:Nuclear pore complex protein n=1 Tax=Forsythia ovata TaxID=205694 RepID=A0ABD1UVA6_9LAMI